jgi:hypothetical protein
VYVCCACSSAFFPLSSLSLSPPLSIRNTFQPLGTCCMTLPSEGESFPRPHGASVLTQHSCWDGVGPTCHTGMWTTWPPRCIMGVNCGRLTVKVGDAICFSWICLCIFVVCTFVLCIMMACAILYAILLADPMACAILYAILLADPMDPCSSARCADLYTLNIIIIINGSV